MAVSPLILVRYWKTKVFWKLENEADKVIYSVYNLDDDKIGKIAMAWWINFRGFSDILDFSHYKQPNALTIPISKAYKYRTDILATQT